MNMMNPKQKQAVEQAHKSIEKYNFMLHSTSPEDREKNGVDIDGELQVARRCITFLKEGI